jgi:hypothetical protein
MTSTYDEHPARRGNRRGCLEGHGNLLAGVVEGGGSIEYA